MVALAPAVADPFVLVDDQSVDAELAQGGRNRQSGLAAAYDQRNGIAIRIGLRGDALVLPVVPPKLREYASPVGRRLPISAIGSRLSIRFVLFSVGWAFALGKLFED